MKRMRKYLLIGSFSLLVLSAVVLILILASYRLTASDAVRKKITAEAARMTGGTLQYEKLALHLLPLPNLTVLQAELRVPGKAVLTTASLAIYPDLLALFGGAFVLKDLVIVRPAVRIQLPDTPVPAGSPPRAVLAKKCRETMAFVFGALARLGPELDVKVKKGGAGLVRPNRPELKIGQIDLTIKCRGQVVALDLKCRPALGGQVTFNGKVDLGTRQSEGRIMLKGLNPRAVLAQLPDLSGFTVTDTRLDLAADFTAEAADRVQARLSCTVPEIEIRRQRRRAVLRKILFKGNLAADINGLQWDRTSLRIGSHGLDLEGSGKVVFGSRTAPTSLELEALGRKVDVAAVARGFTDIAGNVEWVAEAFSVAREGVLSTATCSLTARQTPAGWVVPRIQANGNLSRGLITIPDADLDLADVSGRVVLDNERVDFKQMKGRLQYGTFERLDASIDWKKTATLTVSTSRAGLNLTRFYPWLTAFDDLQEMKTFVQTADGALKLTNLDISGPLTSPEDWKIVAAAGFENVTLTSPKFSSPLQLVKGRAVYEPAAFTLENLHLRYRDADAVTSWKLLGESIQPEAVTLFLDGTIGPQAFSWLRGLLDIPESLQVQLPLTMTGLDLQWNNASHVRARGEIATADGIRAYADVAFSPGCRRIDRLELFDGASDFTLQLTESGGHIDLAYAGKMQGKTLDRLFQENRHLRGWVDGDLKASFDIGDLRSATLDGAFLGEGLVVRSQAEHPIELDRFFITGQGKKVYLESVDLVFFETPMHLKGSAGITGPGIIFDLDLAADSLDAAVMEKLRKAPGTERAGAQKKRVSASGVIRLKTPRFTYEKYTWSPLQAEINIQPEAIHVKILAARLCGISTPGTLTVKPEGVQLALKLSARGQDLEKTWQCLQAKSLRAESHFDLSGTITASGPADDLATKVQGEVTFTSTHGIIHRSNILTRVLTVLNVTEVFAGKATGVGEKGFGYNAIRAHADIRDGVLDLDEILVDAHSMKISGSGTVNPVVGNMAVTLLAAPLKTIDRIVKKVPVIGYLTDGSVLSVPIKVKGSTADPRVVLMAPGAVGHSLVRLMKRVVKAPLKIVDFLPGMKSKTAPHGGESGSADGTPAK